jgi:ABC-type uncharacterized transport system permease subunit
MLEHRKKIANEAGSKGIFGLQVQYLYFQIRLTVRQKLNILFPDF